MTELSLAELELVGASVPKEPAAAPTKVNLAYLHGLEEGPEVWHKVATHLAPLGPHKLLELPWSGKNGYRWLAGNESPVELLEVALDQARFENAGAFNVLVAHSFGTIITYQYLDRMEGAGVDALVLVSPFYCFEDQPLDWAHLDHLASRFNQFLEQAVGLHRGAPLEADIQKRMAELVREKIGPVGCVEFLHHFIRTTYIDLARFRTPTLVLSGEDDLYCSPQQARRIAEAFPNGESCLLEGSGHFAMLDRDREVARAIERHISRSVQAAGAVVPSINLSGAINQ